jgi:DNA-binding transcriptional LysR family regulator
MSSRGFEELWRRALELNVRYYTSLGKLTVEYLSDLAGAMSAQTAGRTETHGAAPPGPQPAPAPQAAKSAAEAVMMLEGEAGIGKSRLVQVLKDRVASEAHLVSLSFREELHAIEAAISGQGIAICSDVLVAPELASGSLVKVATAA